MFSSTQSSSEQKIVPTELSENQNNAITPAIRFMPIADNKLPSIDALYLESFNELFWLDEDNEDMVCEEEKISILKSVEGFLQENKKLPLFIGVLPGEEDDTLDGIYEYLDESSELYKRMKLQLENNGTLLSFKEECKKSNLKHIYLGGVFGKACVWNEASRMAKNVISKMLGDNHPNVRFEDSVCSFRFETAVIFSSITEGHYENDHLFSHYLTFSGNAPWRVEMTKIGDFEKSVKELEKNHSAELGVSYQNFSSVEMKNEEKYEALCKAIEDKLSAYKKSMTVMQMGLFSSAPTSSSSSSSVVSSSQGAVMSNIKK